MRNARSPAAALHPTATRHSARRSRSTWRTAAAGSASTLRSGTTTRFFNTFFVAGSYWKNTWAPTPAVLKVEDSSHPTASGLSDTFVTAANEWYDWNVDLRTRPEVKILCSVDPSSFPLGTGSGGMNELWTDRYHPVVWTNTTFHMVYMNMGHNDIDYGSNTDKSDTFGDSEDQNRLLRNTLRWVGRSVQPTILANCRLFNASFPPDHGNLGRGGQGDGLTPPSVS